MSLSSGSSRRDAAGHAAADALDDSDEEGGVKLPLADLYTGIAREVRVHGRYVSVANWLQLEGMAEVLRRRGVMWLSFGINRGSRALINIEETVYLMERGSLALLLNGKEATMQEAYELMQDPALGCTWEAYQVYAHLRRLGYIVGRHGVPWTELYGNGLDVSTGDTVEIRRPEPGDSATPDYLQYSVERVASSMSTSQANDSLGGHDRSPRHEEEASEVESTPVAASISGAPVLQIAGSGSGTPRSSHDPLNTPAARRRDLQGEALARRGEDGFGAFGYSSRLALSFDVHVPSKQAFKKTNPKTPAFSICVSGGGSRPPPLQDVRVLQAANGAVPIKFAFVEGGHVTIFSLDLVTLPEL
eukprot:SM000091S24584  [mRNA]  locus=s91:137992:141051:- [translate_table: standard]